MELIMTSKAWVLGVAVVCVLLSALAQLSMKVGMTPPAAAASSGWWATYAQALGSVWVWVGLCAYGFSAVLWLWVLSRLEVSVAYPLVSLGFVVTFVVGVVWLGEPASLSKWLGVGCIVLGVGLLAREAGGR
jgi:multidrug transporter EmrE-like cation transporter